LNKPNGNLLNEIKQQQTQPSGRIPMIVQIIESLNEEDRNDLLEALDDTSLSAAGIARALTNRGHKINASAINGYRRGEVVHVPKI
jgi:hypothetical protein